VLASGSPQRRAILEQLGIAFEVRPANIEEVYAGTPSEVVLENALRKASSVARDLDGRLVLGVDTTVVLGGRLYGKAGDEHEARDHLQRLSGRAHEVWSGVALIVPGESGARSRTACTTVWFRALDEETLGWYLRTGEWRERAGSYAIQGKGAALVERVDGDYWNVVGLPVPVLLEVAPELLH
jgi:septum formation protein